MNSHSYSNQDEDASSLDELPKKTRIVVRGAKYLSTTFAEVFPEITSRTYLPPTYQSTVRNKRGKGRKQRAKKKKVAGGEIEEKDVQLAYTKNLKATKMLRAVEDHPQKRESSQVASRCMGTEQLMGCHYFLSHTSDQTLYMVPNKMLAEEMKTRGYKSLNSLHVCTELSALPGYEDEDHIVDSSASQQFDVLRCRPPIKLTIPEQIPILRTVLPKEGVSKAELVVQMFEEKVIDESNKEVFSPLHLWTIEARKAAGFKDSDSFNRRLNMYYYVRGVSQKQNLKDIKTAQMEMIKQSRSTRKIRKSEDGSDDLFKDCVGLFQEHKKTMHIV